jgi:secreted PhoX family phosphatase
MKDDTSHLSWDEWDELQSPRHDTNDFDAIVDKAMSRRGFLGSVIAFGSGAAVMGTGLLSSTLAQAQSASRIGFNPIPIATDATIHVPEGVSRCFLTRLIWITQLVVPLRIQTACLAKTRMAWNILPLGTVRSLSSTTSMRTPK